MDRLRASLSEYLASFRSVPRGHLVRLAANTGLNATVTICVALATCAVLFGSAPTTLVVCWGLIQVSLAGFVFLRQRRNKNKPKPRISAQTLTKRGLYRAIFWAGTSGCIWGSLMGLAPGLPPYEQMLIILVLCGMAAGASATLAAVPSVASTFIAGCTVPVIVYFAFQGGSASLELAFITFIYSTAMINTSRLVSRIVVEREDLETRTELLNLAHLRQTVAAETNLSETLQEAAEKCLLPTCAGLGWHAGIVSYLANDIGEPDTQTHYVTTANSDPTTQHYLNSASSLLSARTTKRVLTSQTVEWIPIDELTGPSTATNGAIAPTGIKSVVAAPVLIGKDIVAITMFLCGDENMPDDPVLETVNAVGTHLGRAIERHRMRMERRKRTKMESLGLLTGSVAHDFNNILAAITGNLELLQKQLSETALSSNALPGNAIAAALNSAERGSNITNSLLLFAHKRRLHPQAANPTLALQQWLDHIRPILDEKVTLLTSFDDGLWNMMVDQTELHRALSNLLLNACDAMPSGGSLTLTASNRLQRTQQHVDQRLAPGRYVSIGLTDTGTGIATDVRPHIFEPFFTTKEVDKGTGLGLSSVLGFAELSAGDVTVNSQVGVGTTVEILLPATDAPVIDVPATGTLATGMEVRSEAEADMNTAHASAPKRRERRALIVEDEPDVAYFVREVLTGEGFNVVIAEDGEQAISALGEDADFDLVLADVVLPKSLSGVDVISRYLELRPQGCPLLTSGYTRQALEDNRSLPEHVELLQKPYRIVELLSSVNRSMSRLNKHLQVAQDAVG